MSFIDTNEMSDREFALHSQREFFRNKLKRMNDLRLIDFMKHEYNWYGETVILEVGQRWQDPDSPQDVARIEKIEGGKVTYVMEAIEELRRQNKTDMNPADTQPIEGTDGFLDFLESNRYQLIK